MQSPNRRGADLMQRKNIAARAAQWSSSHRKLAIWGWLAAVVVLFGVFMGGELVERQGHLGRRHLLRRVPPGRAGPDRRRAAPDRGGPADPERFRQRRGPRLRGDRRAVSRGAAADRRTSRTSPPRAKAAAAISEDGHSVLIDFEIAGAEKDVAENVERQRSDGRGPEPGRPGLQRRAVRVGFLRRGLEGAFSSDLGKAG